MLKSLVVSLLLKLFKPELANIESILKNFTVKAEGDVSLETQKLRAMVARDAAVALTYFATIKGDVLEEVAKANHLLGMMEAEYEAVLHKVENLPAEIRGNVIKVESAVKSSL